MTQLVTRAVTAASDDRDAPLVLLVDPGMPALVHRLREEIESLGLDVQGVSSMQPDEPLESRARAAGAIAAIRIVLSGEGVVEMTILDRATGKTVSRRLAIEMSSDPASAELIATRTVELLRASLMELSAAHPPRGEVSAPPELKARAVERAVELRALTPLLALGSAVVANPGLGVSADVAVGLTLLFRERLGLTAQAFFPVTGNRLATREGEVEIFSSRYRLGGVFSTPLFSDDVSTRIAAGLSLSRVTLSGSTEPPYSAARDALTTWGPWLSAGFGFELTRGLSAWLVGDATFSVPRTVVRSAGREVLDWGRPMGGGALGLELAWP